MTCTCAPPLWKRFLHHCPWPSIFWYWLSCSCGVSWSECLHDKVHEFFVLMMSWFLLFVSDWHKWSWSEWSQFSIAVVVVIVFNCVCRHCEFNICTDVEICSIVEAKLNHKYSADVDDSVHFNPWWIVTMLLLWVQVVLMDCISFLLDQLRLDKVWCLWWLFRCRLNFVSLKDRSILGVFCYLNRAICFPSTNWLLGVKPEIGAHQKSCGWWWMNRWSCSGVSSGMFVKCNVSTSSSW